LVFDIAERRTVYEGRLLRLEELLLADESGGQARREVVRHPGAVAVVPVFSDHTTVLCKQYRVAVDEHLVEVIAGKLKPGEDPEECARRELAEEAGLEAERLVRLAKFYTSPGFCDEVMHVFMAREVRASPAGSSPAGLEEQQMTLVKVRIGAWQELLEEGTLRDAKSIVALCLAAQALRMG
jgi:ADP-ribose pyrophosphatase